MQSSDWIRQMRNGKKYETAICISLNENSESSPIMNAPERKIEEESNARTLTQGKDNEQIRSFIAPLTDQLEYLTRLIQRMSAAQHPNKYPSAGTSASFSASGYQSDNVQKRRSQVVWQ